MNTNMINCPKCQTKIEITQAMTSQLSDQIRLELQAGVDVEKARLEKEAKKVAEQKAANEKAAAEMEQKLKSGIDAGVGAARAALVADAKKKAAEDVALERRADAERVSELEGKLKTAQTTELALRKRERELQEKAESLDLEVARRIKAETDIARDAAKKQAAEEHLLKDKENQEQNASLRRQVEDLRQKLAQGSQQAQGEALELILEDVLSGAFPIDDITPISKGVNGADILQRVLEPSGLDCGSILWETKNSKKWTAGWLPKLRDDQRKAKAELAVIVTEVMPPDTANLTQIDGVWICTRSCVIGLALALRAGLIGVAKSRLAADGKLGKTERAYDYVTGTEFTQRVTGMLEPLLQLQDGLNKERRAMERIWSGREKQIQAAVLCLHGMYGDFQGIVGSTLPTLEGMDLPQLEEGGNGNSPEPG